jgi:hypothetical protein
VSAIEGTTRALPAPRAIYRGGVTGVMEAPWVPLPSVPAPLDRFRLPAEACARFDAKEYPIASSSPAQLAVGVVVFEHPSTFKGTGVLVDTGDGLFYVESSTVTRLARPPGRSCGSVMDAPFYSGFQAAGGALWLGGDCGYIWAADVDLAARAITGNVAGGATHRDDLYGLDGARSGTLSELFVLGKNGQVDRIDLKTELSTNLFVMNSDPRPTRKLGMVEVAPGQVAAITSSVASAFFADGEHVTLERLPDAPSVAPTTIAWTQALGLVVGTATGEIYVRRQGVWRRLRGATSGNGVRTIASYRTTFVALFEDGGLRQYSTETESLCDPVLSIGGFDDATFIAVSGEAIMLIGGFGRGTNGLYYRWLEPSL